MSTSKALALVIGMFIIMAAVAAGGWALKAGMLPFMTATTQIIENM